MDHPAHRYRTQRTSDWRKKDLAATFLKTLDNIEEHGWEVITVMAGHVSPRFAYTIGVYDTLGKPELITVGLTEETAHGALNEAVALMQNGLDLTKGRFREIVGEVEVAFQSVDSKWLHQVMCRADWFYEGSNVPVLQLIYPDIENRFQWDAGFTEYFRQPILAAGHPEETAERSLWSAGEPESDFSNWKFPDPPHTRVYLSETVHRKEEPITYVSHDAEDGAWQFLGKKMDDGGGPVLSCFHHPVDDDSTLEELTDLAIGWYAVRDAPGEPWERFEHSPEESAVERDEQSNNSPLLN